jgi:hypothetical protein
VVLELKVAASRCLVCAPQQEEHGTLATVSLYVPCRAHRRVSKEVGTLAVVLIASQVPV